jgi:hypothetical protein
MYGRASSIYFSRGSLAHHDSAATIIEIASDPKIDLLSVGLLRCLLWNETGGWGSGRGDDCADKRRLILSNHAKLGAERKPTVAAM